MSKATLEKEGIYSFSFPYSFLSNFSYSPIVVDGIAYRTVEHAFQAAKTLDLKRRHVLAAIEHPGDVKRAGRALKLRDDWEDIKDDVMYECLKAKFTTHLSLKHALISTGTLHLEEGNQHGDTYWGTCKGEGKNRLGVLLMRLRDELIALQD